MKLMKFCTSCKSCLKAVLDMEGLPQMVLGISTIPQFHISWKSQIL